VEKKGSVRAEWSRGDIEERLKRISQSIIEAYRAKDPDFIRTYAVQAGIASEIRGAPLNRLFGRVIQIYHPDRVLAVMERVSRTGPADGGAAFLALRQFARSSGSDRKKQRNAESFDQEGEPEEYAFGEEDFAYSEEDRQGPYQGDDFEEAFREEEDPLDILEAIKRAYLGNLDGYPSPLELEMLEGELDLSNMDIDDAEGAQWLKSLSSLNLAGNRIDNCGPLAGMHRLESLDLSDNALEDADALADLEFLSELDLSGNEIEDFAFLTRLPSLRYANLTGNPPLKRALRERLAARGVIVIQ
jgi:hypothetical protein